MPSVSSPHARGRRQSVGSTQSPAEIFASLPDAERKKLIEALTPAEQAALMYDWKWWARADQLPPRKTWTFWLLLAGRGAGKSRAGAEWIRGEVESGRRKRIALVAATAADVRDTVVEGESGILAVCPPWNKPTYEPSKRRITWPNGAIATTFSADEPDRLRGPQHDGFWADELAAWRYAEAWDQLLFGLRLGRDPRGVITTTPRPIPLVKNLLKDKTCVVTRASTYANVHNLAPTFIKQIIKRYEGTRLGQQELYAEILDDTPGALWTRAVLERTRIQPRGADFTMPQFSRIVVAVDPSVSDPDKKAREGKDPDDLDECGIIVAGLSEHREEGYILEDLSLKGSPFTWARRAVDAYHRWGADRLVAEVNNGGAMVELTIRSVDPKVAYKELHASRGKWTRAEPVAALYEQGKVHHIGNFPTLEDQQCSWIPGMDSPDRLDAAVWAITELMLDPESSHTRAMVW